MSETLFDPTPYITHEESPEDEQLSVKEQAILAALGLQLNEINARYDLVKVTLRPHAAFSESTSSGAYTTSYDRWENTEDNRRYWKTCQIPRQSFIGFLQGAFILKGALSEYPILHVEEDCTDIATFSVGLPLEDIDEIVVYSQATAAALAKRQNDMWDKEEEAWQPVNNFSSNVTVFQATQQSKLGRL